MIEGLHPDVSVGVVALHPRRDPAGSLPLYAASGESRDGADVRFARERVR